MERIETTILRNLVFNEEFARKTIPFIQPDFFEQRTDKILFEEIVSFITKYDSCATLEALNIEVENRTDLTAEEVKQINDTSKELNDSPVDNQWLLDITEKWCRDRAIYLALMESIHIADGEDVKRIVMRFLQFYLMHLLFLSIIILDTITYKTLMTDTSTTTERKIKYPLISNTLIKLPKVVYLIRLLTSRLLVQVSGNLYSCATLLVPCCSKDGMYSILQWRWQKRKLLNELTQTY